MKKKFLTVMLYLLIAVPLTACSGGGSPSSSNSVSSDTAYNDGAGFDVNSDSLSKGSYEDDYVEENLGVSTDENTVENPNTSDTKEDTSKEPNNKDKLVYSGNISIDTLTFDETVSSFRKILDDNGGFIESENTTDNGDMYSFYYDENEERHSTYTSRVRIPSKNYDNVMDGVSDLGDVRSKNSNVTNFSQEYKDVEIGLDILQQEYDSYSKLLEQADNTETIITLSDKLASLRTQIEQSKSRLRSIDNDVAYSYIDVTIKEVSKYKEKPEKKDTFFDRLKNTIKDSVEGFGNFLENLLFALIILFPYIILIIIVVLIFRPLHKRFRKRFPKKPRQKKENKYGVVYPNVYMPSNQSTNISQPNSDTQENENK